MKRIAKWFPTLGLASLGILMFATGSARAEDSNRNDVRSNLSQNNWRVVYGKNFTEADWAKGTAAIAESIATENPGPFLKWFEGAMQENYTKIMNGLQGVAKKDIENWILQSLKQKKVITYKGLKIEAGFATYNRWNRIVYDEPRTRTKYKLGVPYPEVYTARVEKKVPLPNWHQFYIRYQLVPTANTENIATNGNTANTAANSTQTSSVRIDYTIWNDTKEDVRFRLPTGTIYILKPGAKGSYHNTGREGAMKIQVLNSGQSYVLKSGSHKFWWMTKESRVGLDLNYRN